MTCPPSEPDDPPLRIRQYVPTDADAVWDVHEQALRASPIEFIENAPADQDLQAITDAYLESYGDFVVGLTGGQLVATGGYQPRSKDTARIRRMRVLPDYQRRGYGEQILQALESRIADDGFSKITLRTRECLTAARKLYQKHGYTEIDREAIPELNGEVVQYSKPIDADTDW